MRLNLSMTTTLLTSSLRIPRNTNSSVWTRTLMDRGCWLLLIRLLSLRLVIGMLLLIRLVIGMLFLRLLIKLLLIRMLLLIRLLLLVRLLKRLLIELLLLIRNSMYIST
ncbi:unnamed protein product [Meloidogyne enterolobii]|uniref:Uncharacterized protein n=1 Tax=Meloidogyne enterolobii TaxID=390850 RepID=A0ACB1ARR7_MELEN